jgi:hypothetical protein
MFALQTDILHHNFTYFSYTSPYQMLYYIWFLLLGIGIYIKLYTLTTKHNKKKTPICHLALLSYLCGGLLPYDINTQNLASSLHVGFSLVAIILVSYILYQIMQSITFTNQYQKIITSMQIGVASAFPIWIINGQINCIIELYALGYVLYIIYQLERVIIDI